MKKKVTTVMFLIFTSVFLYAGKWEMLLSSGLEDFNKGQYSFAITNLKKYLLLTNEADDIGRSKALYYLAVSYYFDGNQTQALVYMDELSVKYKTSDYAQQIIFWRGLVFQNMGNWYDAEEQFLRFVKLQPNSELEDRALLATANCQYEQGRLDSAIATIIRVVNNDKSEKQEEASVFYAYMLLKKHENELARELLESWELKLGKSGNGYEFRDRFWLYLAELNLQYGNDEVAERLLKQIDVYASGSPSSDTALLRLSEIEVRQGNTEVAAEYILRLKNEYPLSTYNIDALLLTGTIAYNEGAYEKAAEVFTETVGVVESSLHSLKNKEDSKRLLTLKSKAILYSAEIYNAMGKKNIAYETLIPIISGNLPLKEEALIRSGELLLEQRKIASLGEFFKHYDDEMTQLRIDDGMKVLDEYKCTRYDLLYARYLYEVKDYEGSLVKVEDVDEVNYFYDNVLVLRAKNYAALGKMLEAAGILRKLLAKTTPENRADVALNLMIMNFNGGNYQEVLILGDVFPVYLKDVQFSKQKSLQLIADCLVGMSYMQQKEYKKSEEFLLRVQKAKERNDLTAKERKFLNESYYYLGWVYYKQSKYMDAATNFAAAGKLIKNIAMQQDALLMEGWCYYSSLDYQQAAVKFTEVFNRYYPSDCGMKALFQAAKSYQNLGNNSKAQSMYQRIYNQLGENSFQSQALYELIRLALADKKFEQANALVNDFGRRFSDSSLYASVLLFQMENFLVQERYSEVQSAALNYLQKYANRKEQIDDVYYWAGYSAYQNKDDETALAQFNILLTDYPETHFKETVVQSQIEIYRRMKNYPCELERIQAYAQEFGDKENKYKFRIAELEELQKGVGVDEARLLARKKQGDKVAEFELAKFYYENSRGQEAFDIMESLQKEDKGVAGARANNFIGDIAYGKGEYKNALQYYAMTISEYKPTADEMSEALYKLAYCYYKLGAKEQAEKYVDMVISRYPNSQWMGNAKTLKGGLK